MGGLLEALGGKSGLKPIHVATRDQAMLARMNPTPSAAREREARADQRNRGVRAKTKTHLRKLFQLKKL